ncbi:MAG: ParB/RepB/Spo0J family partition protein [Patescibacteria group bacterium]
MAQKHGLGRGLSSLIPQKKDNSNTRKTSSVPKKRESVAVRKTSTANKSVKKIDHEKMQLMENRDFVEEVSVVKVRANKEQPRSHFDDEKLDELTSSIKTHGVLQPLIAIHHGDHYELIAGERRLRASKKAGLPTVPMVVKNKDDFDDQAKLELALIENIQRHDLNLIEESKSYKRLSEEFDLAQEEIAVRTGKSRSVVANRIRLLSLPIEIQKGLISGKVSEGHAKVILSVSNPQKQIALYNLIVDEKLTVRQAENKLLSSNLGNKKKRISKEKTVQARRLEDQLTRYFGTKVRVSETASGGNITVSYFSEDDLKGVLSRLKLSNN